MKCFDHTDKDDKCTKDQLQHGALNQSGFIAAAGLQKSENTIYKAESTQNRKCWPKNDMPGSVNFKFLFVCVKG